MIVAGIVLLTVALMALVYFHFKRCPVKLLSKVRNGEVQIVAFRRSFRSWPVGFWPQYCSPPRPRDLECVLYTISPHLPDADEKIIEAILKAKQQVHNAVYGTPETQELATLAKKALKR